MFNFSSQENTRLVGKLAASVAHFHLWRQTLQHSIAYNPQLQSSYIRISYVYCPSIYLTAISESVQKSDETTFGFLKSWIVVSRPKELHSEQKSCLKNRIQPDVGDPDWG